ncbi:MAG: hypothetical protein XE11_1022 [Methanomicrobiales archaeon 53_19]|jgi:hypothetical protein|uniref:DUF2769 domain-containing protein n=1 Tax=Methanocalculus sp. TaxID=2004547 RepID=UPI0007461F19|nr:DUF2769 domain-containing protein [Methanocalculus sp.]KUK70014.1 MAG: hypothetical protein XD88_0922 [Methanocalculus sp. 52_23]KUL03797.1 MAG: hypothetical protein XE11_1022 [Methanomicrobiales archaeon 53_19]HIJ07506.1 DUF2769 domain-containing protein [Methanocalculus sp.]
MDVTKFEKYLALLTDHPLVLSPAERAGIILARKEHCICSTCPTYRECAEKAGDHAFCTIGKSRDGCITDESRGCNCPDCAVYRDVGFEKDLFCTRGTEQQQRILSVLEMRDKVY